MKTAILATAVILSFSTSAFAASDGGDAAKGERVFKKCAACHIVGDSTKKKTGPDLNNLFGAVAGTNAKYTKYSKAMKTAGADGLVWNNATLTEFLTKPKAMIKKTKMSFRGIKKPKDMVNVIAYIATFSPDYKPEMMEEMMEEKATATDG